MREISPEDSRVLAASMKVISYLLGLKDSLLVLSHIKTSLLRRNERWTTLVFKP